MNKISRVIVLLPAGEKERARLEAAAPGTEFVYMPARELTSGQAANAEVIVGNPPASMLAGLKALRWVQLGSAGTDGYTAPGVLPEGVMLTNATGAYGLAISEYMLGGLLTLMKRFHRYLDNQRVCRWQDEGDVASIWGSRVLVVGLGDIGGSFARLAKAMGAHVTGIRRSGTDKPDEVDALFHMDRLDECLKQADIVALSLPETPETHKLFDAERLARVKKGAYLVNVGRGAVLDSDALAGALHSGYLSGAVLDVTDPEPLPPGHPLWQAPNVLITPHVSGGYHLAETFSRVIAIAEENLCRYREGRELRNLVDFATGYRRL